MRSDALSLAAVIQTGFIAAENYLFLGQHCHHGGMFVSYRVRNIPFRTIQNSHKKRRNSFSGATATARFRGRPFMVVQCGYKFYAMCQNASQYGNVRCGASPVEVSDCNRGSPKRLNRQIRRQGTQTPDRHSIPFWYFLCI
jgi:hypothetical protein